MATTDVDVRPRSPRPPRRSVVPLLAMAAAGLLLLVTAAIFLWPASAARLVDVGRAEAFAPGTVTSFRIVDNRAVPVARPPYERVQPRSGIHIVRLDDGELLAFSWASTHRGWAVRWEPEGDHWFRWRDAPDEAFLDPFSLATWLIDGTRVWGPAARNLDQFALEVTEHGRVVVDLSRVIRGEIPPRVRPADAVATPSLVTPTPASREP